MRLYKKSFKKVNYILIYLRGFLKLKEVFFFEQKKLNRDFEIFKVKFLKEYYDKKSFKILRNIKRLNLKKFYIIRYELSFFRLLFKKYFIS